jgi:hypothetical protein
MNIIELAQKCKLVGEHPHLAGIYLKSLERFAELVAAHEREECAKVCEKQYEYYGHDHVFAKAIRARGEA